MNKKIPKVFVNNIKRINNNKTIFYSVKDKYEEKPIQVSEIDINNKINNLFKAQDFVYKKRFHIKTKDYEKDFVIISKSSNYLLTIDGNRIYFNEIIDIK